MNRRGIARLLAVLFGLGSPVLVAAADDFLPPAIFPGEAKPTATRILDARKRIDSGKIAEGIEELQQILDAVGDDLAPVDASRAVQARRLCHAVLAALPPTGLELYRKKVELQARKWLTQARAARDTRLLLKIVDEAFCSRAGEDALNLLGDLAFEAGRFEEAETWWRYLLPRGAKAKELVDLQFVYPDPVQAPARVEAKLLLARLFRGREANWHSARKSYRDKHGQAAGSLAGTWAIR